MLRCTGEGVAETLEGNTERAKFLVVFVKNKGAPILIPVE
jgi:hypothetical protein